jgi:hypothetical protein
MGRIYFWKATIVEKYGGKARLDLQITQPGEGDWVFEIRVEFCYGCSMDIAILQHELELLPEDQQDRLAAFLTALRMKREGLVEEIQRRLDDEDPSNWVSWGEVKAEFGMDESKSGE